VTLVNPWGFHYWRYLIPALRLKRSDIPEWQPLPLLTWDAFIGFRILFVLVLASLAAGWRNLGKKNSWPGLILLTLTAYQAFASRRHTPFFGLVSLAMVGPALAESCSRLSRTWPFSFLMRFNPLLTLLMGYGTLTIFILIYFLPGASLSPVTAPGLYPVREVDILAKAQVRGNLVVPFRWGSYATWRLYPRIKVSMDGRYETAYPESSFIMNQDFLYRRGLVWDRLIWQYPVDFVIVELANTGLRPSDLLDAGFKFVWGDGRRSALFARDQWLPSLRRSAVHLPPATPQPLDATIPQTWWTPFPKRSP
jgi:hypothetical protein